MEEMTMNESTMLRVGTVLRGMYRIDKYLSSGGFGNTYVGYNLQFEERIAIKEFFMKGITKRDDNQTTVSISNDDNKDSFIEQSKKFKKEAKYLRMLKNPHIVGVHDLFEENGTVYYVMDYIDGENLHERLKRTKKPLSEEEVWKLLPQILDALKTSHSYGLLHLDLKPGNIMVDKQGNVKLIDFGACKQLDPSKGGATANTAAVSYTNGYAPREQVEQNYMKFGPWTDIYALGATLYSLLTNKLPPLTSDLDEDDSEDKHESLPLPAGVSDRMKKLILWAMATHKNKRPHSIDEVIDYCNGKKHEETVIGSAEVKKEETTRIASFASNTGNVKQSNSKRNTIIACAVTCVLLIGGIIAYNLSDSSANAVSEQKDGKKGKAENISTVVVVLKSADKLDYHALADNGDGKLKVVESEMNYTPSDRQVDMVVSSDQKMNQQNKIDALLNHILSTYASVKTVFIAQKNLSVDPAMQVIEDKLSGMGLSISYYNPSKYSVEEKSMVEEYINQHGTN